VIVCRGRSAAAGVVAERPGDVGGAGEAQDCDDEVAQAGHDAGPLPVLAWPRPR
jgi:hypothetical protein